MSGPPVGPPAPPTPLPPVNPARIARASSAGRYVAAGDVVADGETVVFLMPVDNIVERGTVAAVVNGAAVAQVFATQDHPTTVEADQAAWSRLTGPDGASDPGQQFEFLAPKTAFYVSSSGGDTVVRITGLLALER